MKTQLHQLVKEYKKTNNQKFLNEIVILLTPIIKSKARFIYHKKWFNVNRDSHNPKYINLKQSGKTTIEDVEQELWLTLIRIIKEYNSKKSFEAYLGISLNNWRPSFLNSSFTNSTNEYALVDYDQEQLESKIDKKLILSLKDKEQEIVKLLQNKTRPVDIAKLLGLSHSYL